MYNSNTNWHILVLLLYSSTTDEGMSRTVGMLLLCTRTMVKVETKYHTRSERLAGQVPSTQVQKRQKFIICRLSSFRFCAKSNNRQQCRGSTAGDVVKLKPSATQPPLGGRGVFGRPPRVRENREQSNCSFDSIKLPEAVGSNSVAPSYVREPAVWNHESCTRIIRTTAVLSYI